MGRAQKYRQAIFISYKFRFTAFYLRGLVGKLALENWVGNDPDFTSQHLSVVLSKGYNSNNVV